MPKVATSFPHLPCCYATTQKSQEIESTEEIGLGNKSPNMVTIMQLLGKILFF